MGLDMYLVGKKYFYRDFQNPEKNLVEDGFVVREKTLRLGYWRKHPNLHGFIVKTFCNGVDDCREIDLSEADIQTIMQAVRDKSLPHTTGFFFGHSDGTEDEETLAIFDRALKWVGEKKDGEIRSVAYEASW